MSDRASVIAIILMLTVTACAASRSSDTVTDSEVDVTYCFGFCSRAHFENDVESKVNVKEEVEDEKINDDVDVATDDAIRGI